MQQNKINAAIKINVLFYIIADLILYAINKTSARCASHAKAFNTVAAETRRKIHVLRLRNLFAAEDAEPQCLQMAEVNENNNSLLS